RVTKARILQAVSEAKGPRAAERIAHLKKGDMAREAETLLADTGWLPEPLRGSEPAVGGETAAQDSTTAMGEDGSLEDTEDTTDIPPAVAAE
ncbi:MAG: DNA-binding protein, partial [Rhizobium oryzihabitans]